MDIPSVLLVLNSLDEELADDLEGTKVSRRTGDTGQGGAHVGGRLQVAGLREDDAAELLFVPGVHRVLGLVDRRTALAIVDVEVALLDLATDILVVRELALRRTSARELRERK